MSQFSLSPIVDSSYVFGITGRDVCRTLQVAGALAFDSGGGVGGTVACNDGSGVSAPEPSSHRLMDRRPRCTHHRDEPDGCRPPSNDYKCFYPTGSGGGLLLSNDAAETGSVCARTSGAGCLLLRIVR
jgi:hypothetical protein